MLKISDTHWERIKHHFPEENIPDGRAGRKPIPTRQVLEAVTWILNTGAQWKMLPQSYPNDKAVHQRFQVWVRQEILRGLLVDLANELRLVIVRTTATTWTRTCAVWASRWSRRTGRTGRTGRSRRRKMVANFADTSGAGSWSDSSLGSNTSVGY